MTIADRNLTPHVTAPRAQGSLRLSSRLRDGRSVIDQLHQSGSSKVLFPRSPATRLDAMMINTAGGITGGDRFQTEARAGTGSRLTLSTQAAERAYRAQPGETGRLNVRLSVEAGARIDWLPQETLLYDNSALARRLEIDVARDATLFAVEAFVFGRHAMGETLTSLQLHDRWRVRRGGTLVFADDLRLSGAVAGPLANPFAFAGSGAMATLLFIGDSAEAQLATARSAVAGKGGASLVDDGVLIVRTLAAGSYELRRMLVPLLEQINQAALPRCWSL